MTDEQKLIKLIATGEQCNIDLGVYQWLAQGFDKTKLVNQYISNHKLNKADFGECYNVRIGNYYYYSYISYYCNFDKGRVFSKICMGRGFKDIDCEVIPHEKDDEYAKYYIRKMLDLLEAHVIEKESQK